MGDETTGANGWMTAAGLLALVLLSLLGDLLSSRLGIMVPGPVVGLGLYLLLLRIWPAFRRWTLPAARLLSGILGALIVPAAVGLAAFAPHIAGVATPLAIVIVVSTLVTGLTTALLYAGLKR